MARFSITPKRLAGLPLSVLAAAYKNNGQPYKLTLAPTYRCNYKCYYCGLWKRSTAELDAATLVNAIAPLKSLTWLDVTGGEIFVRRDIEEICLALVAALPRLALIHFPTSGSYPERATRLAEKLSQKGVKVVVSVSLEGPARLHDKVRCAPGAYGRAVETFRLLARIPHVSVYSGTTIIGENADLVPQGVFQALRQDLEFLTSDMMHFNVMQGSNHYFCNDDAVAPSPSRVASALRRIVRWKGVPKTPFCLLELGFQAIALNSLAGRQGLVPTCSALRSSLFIAPDGTVFPCHIWGEPVGRIDADTSLLHIVKSERWRWLRNQVEAESCPTCWTPCEAYPTLLTRGAKPF
jgi:Fe-coproporphyrin III synthase